MLYSEQPGSPTKSQMKIRDLARSCGWLDAVLRHQERLLRLFGQLAESANATSWMRHWAGLEHALRQHFRVEHDVLAPAIHAIGQRAHAVVAEARRRQIRADLEDLRHPTWEDAAKQALRLQRDLADHFAQEESWGYHALARAQDDECKARLTALCVQGLVQID